MLGFIDEGSRASYLKEGLEDSIELSFLDIASLAVYLVQGRIGIDRDATRTIAYNIAWRSRVRYITG